MTRAALYLRRSTDEHQLESLETQRENARAFASRFAAVSTVIFEDDAKSRAEFKKRPGLLAMLAAAKAGEFDVLVTRDETRLGGDTFRTGVILQDLVDAGVRVLYYASGEEVSFDDPTAKIIVAVRSYASELERLKTSQRTFEHLERKARRGLNVGGRCYGYRNVEVMNGEQRAYVDYEVDQAEAKVVVFIFERYAEGWGLRAIVKDLSERGVPPPRPGQQHRRRWFSSAIWEMLRRERYRGRLVWGEFEKAYRSGTKVRLVRPEDKRTVADRPDLRIVSDELWEAVQARIASNRRRNNGNRAPQGAPPRYLLSGLSTCAECGGSIKVLGGRDGKKRIRVYGCANHHEAGNAICANTLRKPIDIVDQAVVEWIEENVLTEQFVVHALRRVRQRLRERLRTLDQDTPALVAEAETLKKEIGKLAEALLSSDEKPHTLVKMMAEREERLAQAQSRLRGMKTAPNVLELETRRLEKDALKRIQDCRSVMARRGDAAKRALSALLDGKLMFKPRPDKRYEVTGKIVTGALVHLLERPQRDSQRYCTLSN